MTEATNSKPRVLAAIFNTETGKIVDTNNDSKNATKFRLSVRELNGSVNGTTFMVIEFRSTGTNLSYYLDKFKVECDNTKNQLRIWNSEALISSKEKNLVTAQKNLDTLDEAIDEINVLFKDNKLKAELVGDALDEERRELQESVSDLKQSILSSKKNIAKLQASIAL